MNQTPPQSPGPGGDARADVRPAPRAPARNMIAVASGKGGVGKTWFSITLAHALAAAGRRALLFDGDLGLANLDIQLGLMPKNDLGQVIAGRITLAQAVEPCADTGFDVIAGRSGSGNLANLAPSRLTMLADELTALARGYDHVVLDLGAGLERTVRQLALACGQCLVVVTDEPTALTDAYAFIKVMHQQVPDYDMRIVANMVNSNKEGEKTYNTLRKACEGFLKISPPLMGIVRRDGKVRDAIRAQASILTRFPNAEAADDVAAIAKSILKG
jgi:flagellar biosynthesis protein FlhG